MTVKDQLKTIDRKIKQNRADYDLYRNAAEISALSSSLLDKYEYLTGKDLQYKPDPVQKAGSEYSPLGQVFNKGLDSSERQEGLLKRRKNIEDKTDNLNINFTNDGNKLKKIDFFNPQSERSRKLAQKINKIIDEIKRIKNAPKGPVTKKELRKFAFTGSSNDVDYSDKYTDLREFGRDIQNGLTTLNEAKRYKEI